MQDVPLSAVTGASVEVKILSGYSVPSATVRDEQVSGDGFRAILPCLLTAQAWRACPPAPHLARRWYDSSPDIPMSGLLSYHDGECVTVLCRHTVTVKSGGVRNRQEGRLPLLEWQSATGTVGLRRQLPPSLKTVAVRTDPPAILYSSTLCLCRQDGIEAPCVCL